MIRKMIALALAVLLLLCGTGAAFGLYSNAVEDSDFSLSIQKRADNFIIYTNNHTWNSSGTFFFDLYVDGVLVADNVWHYSGYHPVGSSYQITDFTGTCELILFTGGQQEGTVTENMDSIWAHVRDPYTYMLDLNINPVLGTADVYINDKLSGAGTSVTDFWYWLRPGDIYRITNIQPQDGYVYTGPAEFTGTMESQAITVNIHDSYFTQE